MTENTPGDQANQQDTQQTQKSQDTVSQDSTDIQALIQAEVSKTVDVFKNEISGLNRKVTEITKEKIELEERLQETKIAGLKGAELAEEKARIATEKAEAAMKQKEEIEAETVLLKRSRIVDEVLIDAGLPLEFAKRIHGDDRETIQEDVKLLNEHITEHINKGIESGITKRLSGNHPESGNVPDVDGIDAQIKNAQAAGDWTKVMALKSQKANLKKE